jgi:3-dehydrosphinganine reductase
VKSFYGGKSALVVGGSQGIGLALSRHLSQLGVKLWLAARDERRLVEVCRRLGEATPLPLDVTDQTRTQDSLQSVMSDHGVFDFVFNCAGLALPGYLSEQSPEDARTMMEVNYFGTHNVCKVVVEPMIERGRGVIVNTSSLGGLMGLFCYTGYCASKYAVVGFSEALRREVKPFGVQVCILCPPNTDTPGLAKENLTKPAEVLATEENVKTVSPEFVAEKLLKALPRGKSMVIPTFDGWLAYYLARYAPFILEHFVKRPT